MSALRYLFLFSFFALAGCGDSSVVEDASTPADAGTADAGRSDGSISPDAGARDASTSADASAPDATPAPDASIPADASSESDASEDDDAGSDPDAAEDADASIPADAAEDADAGSDPDAGPADGCVLGQVSSTATTSNLDLFGTPAYFNGGQPVAAGTYRISYVDGCMKYGGGQGWTVNAYVANQSCWYVIGASTNERIVVPPGTVGYAVGSGAYADFEDCVAASLQVPPVEFTLAQPTPLGVWLLDSPYGDNMAGLDNRNPTWQLSVVTSSCAP